MKFSAEQIAGLISGTIEGNPQAVVNTVSGIETAEEGSLAFLANPKYFPLIYDTKATIVLVSRDFKPEKPVNPTLVRVDDPYHAFAGLLGYYQKMQENRTGISPLAYIHPEAVVGPDCYVGEFAWIGAGSVLGNRVKVYPQTYVGDQCRIGDESILYPGVKIYHGCRIGKSCILHSGVVIGADGFGFAVNEDHAYDKVPQIGNVVMGDRVEVGANTAIDRSTMGSTLIGAGVKLDNFVQIAHNVEIGENTVIAAHTGVSGSTKIGKNCLIAGQVGFVGHIRVADGVKIGAQSGVSAAVSEEGKALLGTPAVDASLQKRILVWIRKLPELAARLASLESRVHRIEDQSGNSL
ncbi:MAG TPA: UDP-3-O-(3-hydroxymyristoyl)glucosamine N-acyltransferase [Bacteroidales bacterium]|nr:UDP-3-O-(3-hydroxymyristoyl)glucosamine N-acyltransferase [Bacteroidales bacterium]HRZ48486.1 UDP-3-O-(3-hydroxymyristoyl)glucosamine N-acyltransferase [Bacteroidales bacterium]